MEPLPKKMNWWERVSYVPRKPTKMSNPCRMCDNLSQGSFFCSLACETRYDCEKGLEYIPTDETPILVITDEEFPKNYPLVEKGPARWGMGATATTIGLDSVPTLSKCICTNNKCAPYIMLNRGVVCIRCKVDMCPTCVPRMEKYKAEFDKWKRVSESWNEKE